MIEAVEVEGFRGLRRLKVEGLGRVNLIVGRNNSGKTALMEALAVAADIEDTADALLYLQELRLPDVSSHNFQRFWLPFFLNAKEETEFVISADTSHGEKRSVRVRKGEAPHEIAVKSRQRALLSGLWAIDIHIEVGQRKRDVRITANSEKIDWPKSVNPDRPWSWIQPNKNLGPDEVQHFSELKQAGRESLLLEVLRHVDSQLSSVELLAPTGDYAELFVRMGAGSPLLNIAMMGDGFQRCFEIGVTAVGSNAPALFIDEFENGLHHSVLEHVWRWLASISATRNLQIFATTHSEECIQAAARAFSSLGG